VIYGHWGNWWNEVAYAFKSAESENFTIVEIKKGKKPRTVGHVRVKPSGVLWAGKSGQTYYRLSIKKFGELAEKYGTKQKQ
jgi:hypothetical protein